MAIRPFAGIQTISGTAQPVFGTTCTAAFQPPPDQFLGGNGPGTNQTQVEIPVTSSKGFRVGDQVAIGPAAAFVQGTASVANQADVGTIKQIVDATHILVQGLIKGHASGEFVVLDEVCGNVHIIPVTTAAVAYIGNSSAVSSTDESVFDVLPIVAAGAAPGYVHDSESIGISQPMTTTSYWIIGTAADKFLARFTQV